MWLNYHNITKDDMNNGDGLRVVLWVAGCGHHCEGCQNPQTWDVDSGIPFDDNAKQELFTELKKDYISGITFSGGDPFHYENRNEVFKLIEEIKARFPNKTVWVYTGYEWEQMTFREKYFFHQIDVVVDGKFVEELKDVNYPWAGSTNQRVIDVKKTMSNGKGKVILYERS